MITLKQWEDSKMDFMDFIKSMPKVLHILKTAPSLGVVIDKDLFYYWLEVLPPIGNKGYSRFLCSEPQTHRENGEPVYWAFSANYKDDVYRCHGLAISKFIEA